MLQTSTNHISIIFFCLFISTSQNFLRKTKEEEPLSICFPLDPSGPNNTPEGINIVCSGNICHGTINNENIVTFTNNVTTKTAPKETTPVEVEGDVKNPVTADKGMIAVVISLVALFTLILLKALRLDRYEEL